jgi:dihydroflavonol-4-reductase
MIQPGKDSPTLDGLDLERIYCDLLDKDSVIKAAQGHDYIIHIAALTTAWPSRHELYYKVNLSGTRNILDAAKQNSIEKLVYVSSASCFGYGTADQPGTEESPFKSAHYKLDYIDSKKEAQDMVLKAVREEGIPVVVVNPTFMIGPYDSKPTSGAMILAVAKGKIPGISVGGKNWAAAKDVAVGVCNALDNFKAGECYILGGANLTYKEAVQIIAKTTGAKPPRWVFPKFVTLLVGRMGSFYGRLLNTTPVLSLPMAQIACDHHYFSSEKAIRELNLPQTPLEDAVKEAYNWFLENKYI